MCNQIYCTCGRPAFTYLKGAWWCIECVKANADKFWPVKVEKPTRTKSSIKVPAPIRHQEPVRDGFDGYLDLAYKLANMSFQRFFPTRDDMRQAARLAALEAYNELGDGQIFEYCLEHFTAQALPRD
jgi:hypothetical protein